MSDNKTVKRGRGRPKGARNKSKLIEAQFTLDRASVIAADTLVYLMENNKEKLEISDDVPPSIRLQACKVVMDKAIANEKDKDSASTPTSSKSTNESEDTPSKPRVLTSAK